MAFDWNKGTPVKNITAPKAEGFDWNKGQSVVPKDEPPEVKRNFMNRMGALFSDVIPDFAVGAAKGAASSIKDFQNLAGKLPFQLAPGIGGRQSQMIADSIPEKAVVTESPAERVGFGTEQVAELLVPVGGGGKKVAQKLATSTLDDVLKAVTPRVTDLTPTEYEKLLSAGRILPKTKTQPAQYILSEAEKEIATKYQKLFKGKDPVKNIGNVIGELEKQDKAVGEFLKTKNAIFNGGELKNQILAKLADVNDIAIDPTRLANAKKELAENFVKGVKKKDMVSLWKARKAFDRQIERVFSGAPTLQNQVKRELRNAVQDFISGKTDDVTYKSFMKDMSKLVDVKDLLATKATKERALSGLKLWMKNNPTKVKSLEVIGGGTILYGLGKKLGLIP